MSSVFMPAYRDGSRGLVRVSTAASQEMRAREDERKRCARVQRNRDYYHGTQFDARNEEMRVELALPDDVALPEHLRLNAYSTQIAECVDFIANQLTNGFEIIAADEKVQDVIDRAIDATDALHNDSDEEIGVEDIMIDGAQSGDTPYRTLWDPVDGTVYWEFWDACDVEFYVPEGRWVREVTTRQKIWVEMLDDQGQRVDREVQEKVVYDLAYPAVAGDTILPVRECRAQTFYDEAEEPEKVEWLGLPFIPWGVLRVDKRGLRGFRGDPLISRKAIDNADRYNANEQTAYLIARYNSHGNIAVTGDQAFIKLELEPIINKDIADVLRFPGGTSVSTISLPTDPTMIQHTSAKTADAIYASFGLVRVEPDTLNGIGGISGYALEILNRKSEGTFKRVRRTFKTDFAAMINQGLDVTAYRQGSQLTDTDLIDLYSANPDLEVDPDLIVEVPFWEIDPKDVFPQRDMEIRMGTGYIVDDVLIRDNFTAGLYSREEALRRLGLSDADIQRIVDEIGADKEAAAEAALAQAGRNPDGSLIDEPVVAPAGTRVDQVNGKAVPAGTQAGRTVGAADRE